MKLNFLGECIIEFIKSHCVHVFFLIPVCCMTKELREREDLGKIAFVLIGKSYS